MSIFYKKGLSFRWARLLSLLLLLPFAGRAQSTGPSTTVVISQIYGGGGNASASYRSDFIELHNISTVSQTLTGYSVQYNSATGAGNYSVTALPASVTIPAGGYYLVQEATNGTATPALNPAGDVTGTINLSASTGKVALVSSTTALGPTCTTDATIIDFVGFGGTANCAETTRFTTIATGNAFSFIRMDPTGTANNGCKDTNDNSADFTTASPPMPRSSTSAVAICGGVPTAAEINVKQGTTTYLTGSSYSGFASTTVGSTDTKTFTIENLGGTVLNVSSITATGDYSVSGVPTTVAANSTATFTVTFTPTTPGTRTGVLTINNDDADEATYTINLSGNATATTPNPMIAVSQGGTAYANTSTFSGFANTTVGSTSPAVTFTITNSSTTDALVISGITTTGNFAVSGTVPTTVAANSTATFDLTFTPTAGGTRMGTVTIANNSQGTPSYVINLSGTGVVPAPTLTTISPNNPVGGVTYD
ncbi:MAG: choice-of-anchor D domain-containing protein, partial [Bacteroidota bacterium]|nr:choice-of-anchor D domain-containing protein [Bacteroidota bacterium]